MGRQITRDEAAALAGVTPDTFSGYVSRGQAPGPVRHVSRTPLWDEAKVQAWVDSRPGRGTRGTARALRRAAERAQTNTENTEGS
jgi:predicted DNA-binding transcriptional regulator AlpA